jgi:hypothetical protein
MEHMTETSVTQVPGEDLDATLAQTVRLFISQVSKAEETRQAPVA